MVLTYLYSSLKSNIEYWGFYLCRVFQGIIGITTFEQCNSLPYEKCWSLLRTPGGGLKYKNMKNSSLWLFWILHFSFVISYRMLSLTLKPLKVVTKSNSQQMSVLFVWCEWETFYIQVAWDEWVTSYTNPKMSAPLRKKPKISCKVMSCDGVAWFS